MATVDPDDDSIERWVVHHYRYDPARRERRNVVIGAFDNEPEFMAFIHERSKELRAAKERGEAEAVEWLSGMCRWPGYQAEMRAARRARNALFGGKPKGARIRKRGENAPPPPDPAPEL